MQILVKNIVNHPSECPYAEWKPYPPIVEQPGIYICKGIKTNTQTLGCNLNTKTKECRFFKQLAEEINE